ncbi:MULTISPECIES: glycoside hydrolase family 43 protein [Bacillaceae]|uniref:Glycoside hydrolase family 43 protein n=1 Tax=Evansella alkalicola TaxID=745819 RepID=A0ABS6JYA8_9BACI|nr:MULTISPECIES: glycoside hydrolase family 43 protein [Bacillaceae]MBU9723568.1 glycoside hydrolase family 43 protein [Bacillus alkalicola]
MLTNKEIQIRDPFIFPDHENGKYYMFGSTDKNIWGSGTGFDVYIGEDLAHWEGPFPVFRPKDNFFSNENYWAPEVHQYQGLFYMFATFFSEELQRRGTAILVSDSLTGPFEPHSDGIVTPKDWESLDGTLYIDEEGKPWMVFCHEWVQVEDGEVCAMPLSEDLKECAGEPQLLFCASEAPWATSFKHRARKSEHNYVTDGPFLYRASNGELLLLWASFVNNVYAQGIARSTTGKITGPWKHDDKPIYQDDGGHGMLFKTFDEELRLTLHSPNKTPLERPIFVKLEEEDGALHVVKE